jgi:hypothetical protein
MQYDYEEFRQTLAARIKALREAILRGVSDNNRGSQSRVPYVA